jgi:hypothetical protein
MKKFRLEIELVPSSVWRSSLYLCYIEKCGVGQNKKCMQKKDANVTSVVLRKEDSGVTMHAFLRGEIRFFKFDATNTKTYMGAMFKSNPLP